MDDDAAQPRALPRRAAVTVPAYPPDLLANLTNPPPRVGPAVPLAKGSPRSSARGSPTRQPAAPQRPAWGLPRDCVGAPTSRDGLTGSAREVGPLAPALRTQVHHRYTNPSLSYAPRAWRRGANHLCAFVSARLALDPPDQRPPHQT